MRELVHAGCLLLLGAGITNAQEDQARPARLITVQNLAPFPRQEWASAVVPFAQGQIKTVPDAHVGDGATVWQPIGSRWPDGSLRQALCLFPIAMRALSEVLLPIHEGPGAALPKGTIVDPLRASRVKLSIHVTRAGKTVHAVPAFVRTLEENAARRVSLYRCRVGKTGLVFEVIVTACTGQSHSYTDLALFYSDPTTPSMQISVDRVWVQTTGMRLVIRHAAQLAVDSEEVEDGSAITLLRNNIVGDGQGIRRSGVLAPRPPKQKDPKDQTLRAAAIAPILAATSWHGAGAYGPFGHVPRLPPWMRGRLGRTAFARRHAHFARQSHVRGGPFRSFRFGLLKYPGSTGTQEDFGILKLSPVASTGLPSFLLEVELSVLQEGCRPVHFFEDDGTPLQSRNHPDWCQWDGRTHWHCRVSKDRLGKPCPQPKFFRNEWHGKDRQHGSSNYLCGYYLLTGSHWALREIQNEVQLFLAGQTVQSRFTTSTSGAPRAAGRMLMLGCWLYQCTGDEALLARMHKRMEKSYLPCWIGRTLGPDKVRVMAISDPDNRALGPGVHHWTPWQESLAALGFAAFHKMTGNAIAEQMADAISLSVLRYGWLIDRHGAHVGLSMRWNEDGSPLTRQQLVEQDPKVCRFAGGGIAVWSMASVEIALGFARRRKDAPMIERAERILALLRAGRNRPPRDGWLTEYHEWDAVGPR